MAVVGEIEFSHPSDALPAVTVSPDLRAWARSLNLLTDASSANQAGTTIITAKTGQIQYTWSMVLSDLSDDEYYGLLALVRYTQAGYSGGTQSPIKFLDKTRYAYPMEAPHEKNLVEETVFASGLTTGYLKVDAIFDGAEFQETPMNLNRWRAELRIRELV